MKYFIRFGDIPEGEKSSVWRGDEFLEQEKGVSVYPALYDESKDTLAVGLLLPVTRTTLYTLQHLIEYDDRPCYLVTGQELEERGADGEPLLVNVRILKEIKDFRKKV